MTDDERDTRTRILDAAEVAFADGGLAGARVAAIAAAADVNKAMLYYYFDNKEALYAAVVSRVFEQVVEVARGVGADVHDPPSVALSAFMDGYAEVIGDHPHFVRVLLRSLLDTGPGAFAFALPRLASVVPLVAGQVQRGQAEGTLNPALLAPLVPPALVAPIVFISLAGPILASVTDMDEARLRQLWLQNTRELLLNGLVARPSEDS